MSNLQNENGNYTQAVIDDGSIWEGEMRWSQWEERYKPVINYIQAEKYPDHPAQRMFETYGEELDYINTVEPEYVWTWISGDMSDLLVAGKAFVNRLGYYVCEEPWKTGDEQVLISVEVECECYDEEAWDKGEREDAGDPNCPECEGYGLRTEYLD